jgi:ribose 5-phosphate isomerase B
MNIAIACDHAGFQLKEQLKNYLSSQGHNLTDVGTHDEESVDYPDYGRKASLLVSRGDVDKAILICGSGTGMAMTANKVKGVRAANCTTVDCAVLSVQHNNSNVLCLGARFVEFDNAKSIIDAWLSASFEGGRHARRVEKIDG